VVARFAAAIRNGLPFAPRGAGLMCSPNRTKGYPMTDVTITVRDDGNLKVTGPMTLFDGESNRIDVPEDTAVFLRRCGQSATKPFCDSSPRETGFTSEVLAAALIAG
jgi:CDGSH-type Zn-finger protein